MPRKKARGPIPSAALGTPAAPWLQTLLLQAKRARPGSAAHLHHVALHRGETSDSNNDLWQVTTDGKESCCHNAEP